MPCVLYIVLKDPDADSKIIQTTYVLAAPAPPAHRGWAGSVVYQ